MKRSWKSNIDSLKRSSLECNIANRLRDAIVSNESYEDILNLLADANLTAIQQKEHDTGNTLLHTACKNYHDVFGHVVMKLVEIHPGAIKEKNNTGFYPLDYAFLSCKKPEKILVHLMEAFPAPAIGLRELFDDDGFPYISALHSVLVNYVPQGFYPENLIKRIIELNPTSSKLGYNGSYPIHVAIAKEHSNAIIRLLLDLDPDTLSLQDSWGYSTLHYVCEHKNLEILAYMIKNSNVNVNVEANDGMTPVEVAWNLVFDQGLNLLLQHPDIDINKTNKNGETLLHYFLGNSELFDNVINNARTNVNAKNREGRSPLHVACIWNSTHRVNTLFCRSEIDVNATDMNGNAPIHFASKQNNSELLSLFINHPNFQVNVQNLEGQSPLHIACAYGATEAVKILLLHKEIDVNVTDITGNTPLHIASQNERIEQPLICLINHSSTKINAQNRDGKTPLHLSCGFERTHLNLYLLVRHHDSNVNSEDVHGNTPLHCACQHKYVNQLQYLLDDPRTKVNKQNHDGMGPLHVACCGRFSSGVHKLLCHPEVDVNAKDSCKNTPLHHVFSNFYCWLNSKSGPSPCLTNDVIHTTQHLLNHPLISIKERNRDNATALDYVNVLYDNHIHLSAYERTAYSIISEVSSLFERFLLKQRQQALAYISAMENA